MNFDKKRSVPNEIPLEVEVFVVKMIVITRDDCTNIVKMALSITDQRAKILMISDFWYFI